MQRLSKESLQTKRFQTKTDTFFNTLRTSMHYVFQGYIGTDQLTY